METPPASKNQKALFPGLVYGESGEVADVVHIGDEAFYVILDDGFRRHVEASTIDNAVIADLQEHILSMREEIVPGMLQMLGKTDLFTKAAVDSSIRNLDTGIRQGNPEQWAPMLKLLGFRVVVDIHGNVVEMIYPSAPEEED